MNYAPPQTTISYPSFGAMAAVLPKVPAATVWTIGVPARLLNSICHSMQVGNSSVASLMLQESTMEDLMLKCLLLSILAAAVSVGVGYAQSNTNGTTAVNKTAATSGKQMYINYCASCHGVEGRGNGPAAATLKMPPTDLTALSRNNHGEFPETHIVTVLQYGVEFPSHGSAEMPVWGPIFGKMEKVNPQIKQLRISNLIRYLKTLQVK